MYAYNQHSKCIGYKLVQLCVSDIFLPLFFSGLAVCVQHQPSGKDNNEPPCRTLQTNDQDLRVGSLQAHPATQGQAEVINSLAPGKFEWKFSHVIWKQILVIDGWGISCEIALIWMSLDFTDDQSILVQVMAWCHQATSHYLSQCWPRSLSPYGVTRPQWVNSLATVRRGDN